MDGPRQWLRRWWVPRRASAAGVVLGAVLAMVAAPLPAVAAGAAQGPAAERAARAAAPADPTLVYQEDFENLTGDPTLLDSYTGAPPRNMTYAAHPGWLKGCNGWVLNKADSAGYAPGTADCGSWWNSTRDLSNALGQLNGSADPDANHAVAAFTVTAPAANSVQFETERPVPVTPGRFYTFAASSAAFNCHVSGPQLKFFLMDGATAIPASAKPVNPCTDRDARTITVGGKSAKAVHTTSDAPVLFNGDALGVRMVNGNGSNAGNDAAFDDIQVMDVTPRVEKAFSPVHAAAGGTSTLTFTVTNTSDLRTKKGWSFKDDLPAGLTVADPGNTRTTCTNGSVTAAAGGGSVGLKGDLVEGQESCTLSVDVTAAPGEYKNCPENVGDLSGMRPPTECATVRFSDPSYKITKTSSPASGDEAQPGDKVTYKVVVENTGPSSMETPVTDDLTGVLDDGTYNGDAQGTVGTPAYTSPRLTWSPTLDAGQKATLTYSVTMKDPATGDGVAKNVVKGSSVSNCVTGAEDGCTTEVTVPRLDIAKSSDKAAAKPGDKVTYTVTVTNQGKKAYKDATFTDDLTGVLDDAAYDGDAKATSGEVSYARPKLTWTGDVPAGATVKIKYSVTVDAPDNGDKVLGNVVTGPPGSDCPDGCTTETPVGTLHIEKTSDKAEAEAGDKVTYTVTVTNTGKAAYKDAKIADDLTGVIDDATYNEDADATSGSVSYKAPKLSWKGDVAAGATARITYSVTVATPPGGDKKLTNTVVSQDPGSNCQAGSDDPDCGTDVGLRSLKIKKTAAPRNPKEGDTLSYKVVVTNDGQADYPGATFTDDLTKVLDDATYNGDAEASAGDVSYAAPELTWTGDLAEGETATVTYTFTVTDAGNGRFVNGVVGPPDSNCPEGETDPDCTTVLPAPDYDFGDAPDTYKTRRASGGAFHEMVDGLRIGRTVEPERDGDPHSRAGDDADDDGMGTVTLHQHQGSHTAKIPVTNTTGRDATLAGWVDANEDGTFDADEMVTADVPDGATEATLTWNGLQDMKPGETFARLRLFGDEETSAAERATTRAAKQATARAATHAVTATGFGGPGEVEDHMVRVEPAHLELAKSASSSAPKPGDTVTYTVTVGSSGGAEYMGAAFTDDLTEVLDDAAYNGDAEASAGDVSYDAPKLSWSGTVPAGEKVTVTYSVTVDDPVKGDRTLTNAVTGPPDSTCASDCTTTAEVPPAEPDPSPEPPTPGNPDNPDTPAHNPPGKPGEPGGGHLSDTGFDDVTVFLAAAAALALGLGALVLAAARRSRRRP
ncbi:MULTISPECIES: GEVED domain-containing protein [unclassified Streptomyces]|uniref:DUF7927 domain-containing protein n=1 Tax=unclassified Streptomyces TaxID=2593676 RepID=UPI002E17BAE5|nr:MULTISPECIES: GEVED domain-containing protein [unclassified Streptomyces]